MRFRPLLLGLLVAQGLGCGAVRSTYHLAQAEQAVIIAKDSEAAAYAPYEWILTEEYIEKAREEWSNAAYGDAEDLSKRASEWAARAEQAALRLHRYKQAEGMHEIVPEEIDVNEPRDDDPFAPEERLEIDIDEDEP